MEFKKLKNLETDFRFIRITAIVFGVLCFASIAITIFMSYRFAEQQRQKIYVLDGGKSLMLALAQNVKTNRPVEAREHIRRFHELFFTLAPDGLAIENNINRALNMADDSAYKYYEDLSENRYYTRLINTSSNQVFELDSIVVDFDVYPYDVLTYGKQKILRRSNVTERSLITGCQLVNTVRSDNNPQGFMIKDFRVIENRDITTYEVR